MGAGAFCNVCQIVITYFDNELLKNETLEELGDVLEKGCELLPTPFTGMVSWGGGGGLVPIPAGWNTPEHRIPASPPLSPSQCEALVVQYEPAAVRLLVQMMDPNFVCTVSVPVPWVLQLGRTWASLVQA